MLKSSQSYSFWRIYAGTLLENRYAQLDTEAGNVVS